MFIRLVKAFSETDQTEDLKNQINDALSFECLK